MALRCKETGKKTDVLAEGMHPEVYEKHPASEADSKGSIVTNIKALEEELNALIEQFKRMGDAKMSEIEKRFKKRQETKQFFFQKFSMQQTAYAFASLLIVSGLTYGGYWYYTDSQKSWKTTVVGENGSPTIEEGQNGSVDPNDPFTDSDGDRIPDRKENKFGVNPNNADTDDDGVNDYDEIVLYGTNPLVADTDIDGLTDGEEIMAGTNPLDPEN